MQTDLFNKREESQAPRPLDVQIEAGWKRVLHDEFSQDYFKSLKSFLLTERESGKTIYPAGSMIFNAFNTTPFDNVKVVILGQDPYHGKGQAHGLSFSVPDNISPPPSLKNIFKELTDDLDIAIPSTGNLTPWARQGVFLLNSILTVRANEPASHRNIGWERFTDHVISQISTLKDHVVFMLWGRYAREKAVLINDEKHMILQAAHPSPYSANNGFLGCKHFSRANEFLKVKGQESIDFKVN